MENVIKDNRLMYKYIRGSVLYNLNTETSDVDYGGVFCCKPLEILDLGKTYRDEISNSTHDETYYEVKKWLKLLAVGNPNQLESLYVPKNKIIGDVHPFINEVKSLRNEFISKKSIESLFGYAYTQIKKCKGLNKMMNQEPIFEKKTPLDFCYTFLNQGSTNITNWLNDRGLKQKYCGLVNVPNMHEMYHLFYDFGNHFLNENVTFEQLVDEYIGKRGLGLFIVTFFNLSKNSDNIEFLDETLSNIEKWYNSQKPIGYSGIIGEEVESHEVRLSSVEKGSKPICQISYNQHGYSKHCNDYKRQETWKRERNPIRYESNLKQNYDAKNVSHAVRLIHMGLEIVNGEGFNVERTWDRDFILKVKNHGVEYDEIMEYVTNKVLEFEEKFKKCNLKEKVDDDFINELLIGFRKEQLKSIL